MQLLVQNFLDPSCAAEMANFRFSPKLYATEIKVDYSKLIDS